MATKEKRRVLFAAEYIGGYKDRKKMQGMFSIYETYVQFKALLQKPIEIPLSEVKSIVVEKPEDTSKRVTATRLIAVGIFAFAFKKKTKESFVVVELKGGEEAIFNVKGVDTHTMRAKLSSVAAEISQAV